MFRGPGEQQCDIDWLIDVDPTQTIFRQVPIEGGSGLVFTFKQAEPTASCTMDFHTTRFFRPQ